MRIHNAILTAALIVSFFLSLSIGSSQTNLESKVAGQVFLLSSDDYKTRLKAGEELCKLGTNAASAIPAIMQLMETNPDKFHDNDTRSGELPKRSAGFQTNPREEFAESKSLHTD